MPGPTRDDDPRRELRLTASSGVDWMPILDTVLQIWLPDGLTSRADEIRTAVTDTIAGGDRVAIVLWCEGDDVVAGVGSSADPTATHSPARVVGRWSPVRRG
jgi:hypothetical protein